MNETNNSSGIETKSGSEDTISQNRPMVNDNQLPGTAPDDITSETLFCPVKNVQCPYYSIQGCPIEVCWMGKKADKKTDKKFFKMYAR